MHDLTARKKDKNPWQ